MHKTARVLAFACFVCVIVSVGAERYEPTLESLSKHNAAPEWFRDAKIGIYFHWGVYSVPAFGNEWYPRQMHLKNRRENKHHVETYGEPTEFGYADFVPQFTAEKFDAEEWADLFVKSGAKFAGPVCEHHDGFALWDSDATPWNSADMGPKRDLTGELEKAIRARDMRFVATFHHARNNLWGKGGPGNWSGHYSGVKENYPALLDDPKAAILYGYMPREKFLEMWKAKLVEVIDNYQPDLIWFDSWLDEIPEQTQFEFAAHYLNAADRWGREVVITRKQNDLPLSFSIEDFEKGRADKLTDNVWLTDDTISKGSWCHTRDLKIKPANEVIETFVDLVSKNGQLLLNISPKADGTIPQDQRECLLALGAWLETNGEAIYNTRPWLSYGEGPTKMRKGGHFVGHVAYGADDIRYTRSKDGQTLYAITLGWPNGPLTLASVKADGPGKVALLGYDGEVASAVNEAGQLVITPPALEPDERPSAHAVAFRITGAALELHEDAAIETGAAIPLPADKATIDGDQAALETKNGSRPNIGFWDNADESIHWLARVTRPGRYRVDLEYANTAAGSVRLGLADQTLEAALPATGNWGATRWITLGTIEIDKPGVRHIVLGAQNTSEWNAVNVWGLRLLPTQAK